MIWHIHEIWYLFPSNLIKLEIRKNYEDRLNLDLCTVECPEPGCAYSTSSLSSLQSHRLIHGRKNARLKQSRTCPACRISLETPKAIRDHVLECHSEVIDKIVHCILDEQCSWQNDLGMIINAVQKNKQKNISWNLLEWSSMSRKIFPSNQFTGWPKSKFEIYFGYNSEN